MKYQSFDPPEVLKPFVRSFWSLESDAASDAPKSFRTMADGCPGLIFQHADKGIFSQNGKELPDVFLFGQTTRHAEIGIRGEFSTVGVYLYPHAIRSVFGFSAGELTDTCMDADLLANKQQLHLSEQLANATTSQQVDLLLAFLSSQIKQHHDQQNGPMQYALTQIIQSKGLVALKQLHEYLQLTERTFERHFKQYTGISPKLFSRICRFQSSLQQLRSRDFEKLSDIAFENSYADQSHFIRAFKEFAGISPQQYHKQANVLTERFADVTL